MVISSKRYNLYKTAYMHVHCRLHMSICSAERGVSNIVYIIYELSSDARKFMAIL